MTNTLVNQRPARYTAQAWIGLVCCVLLAVVLPAMFMKHQSLWVDETTQLSGLTLNPIEVTTWLAGEEGHRFGVPPDRAPPMSYWVGWTWSSVFGSSETSMRWMAVVLIALATMLVFDAGHRAWGFGAAIASGLLFALSPNVVVNAVEIRSYPLLLLISAAGFWCLVGWLSAERQHGWWLAGLLACCVVGVYTHFFGLLLTGSVLTGAFVGGWFAGKRVRWVLVGGLVVGFAAIGIKPFFDAASKISGVNTAAPEPGIGELAKFIYRALHGHPSLGTSIVIAGAASVAFLSLGLLSLLPKQRSTSTAWAIIIALAAGMIVAVGVSFAASTFDAMHPSYNLWRLPGLALLLGSTMTLTWKLARQAAVVLMITLIGGELFASVQLVRHGDWFSHGPHRRLRALLNDLGANSLVVVHDGDLAWGQGYYPLRFDLGKEFPQYADEDLGSGVRLKRLPEGEIVTPDSVSANTVVVVQMKDVGWAELAEELAEGGRSFADGPVLQWYRGSPEWNEVRHEVFFSMFAADVHVFTRRSSSPQGP